MKKILIAFAVVLGLLILCVYIFLPAHQTLTESIRLHVPQKALQRMLLAQSTVREKADKSKDSAAHTLSLMPDMYDGFILRVPYKNTTHNSLIRLLTLRNDTTFVHWNAVVRGGSAPWQRAQTWITSRQIKDSVEKFLSGLRRWEQPAQVYGFAVAHEKVKDTAFMATRFATTGYPGTEAIYRHIALLEQYISSQQARAVGYPMLHVQKKDRGFEAMVALPVSRLLPGAGPFEPKRMIMGNILSAEVKGGTSKVEAGMQQLQYYVADHNYTSPAIPYFSLVTDRTKERDTTRWITKLYYPVM